MADFAPWLHASNDALLTDLKGFATGQAAAWPYWSNEVGDYVAVIDAAAPANAAALKLTLYAYFVRWQAGALTQRRSNIKFGSIAMLVAGLVIAGFLLRGIFDPTFLNTIAKAEQARGLMTFLFAFSTTSVIVVVTIGVLWVPKDEIDARFTKAKDILTILISVLGTILGFYFGSINTQQNTNNNPPTSAAISAQSGQTGGATGATPGTGGATSTGGAAAPASGGVTGNSAGSAAGGNTSTGGGGTQAPPQAPTHGTTAPPVTGGQPAAPSSVTPPPPSATGEKPP